MAADEDAAPDHQIVVPLRVPPGGDPASQETFGQETGHDDGHRYNEAGRQRRRVSREEADQRERDGDQRDLDPPRAQQPRGRALPVEVRIPVPGRAPGSAALMRTVLS
jgi:hypothetical protein